MSISNYRPNGNFVLNFFKPITIYFLGAVLTLIDKTINNFRLLKKNYISCSINSLSAIVLNI